LDCLVRMPSNKHMNVIRLNLHHLNLNAKFLCFHVQQLFQAFWNLAREDGLAILRAPDEVILDVEDTTRIPLVPVNHTCYYTTVNKICKQLFGKEVWAHSSVT